MREIRQSLCMLYEMLSYRFGIVKNLLKECYRCMREIQRSGNGHGCFTIEMLSLRFGKSLGSSQGMIALDLKSDA
jgi:hypothetical protein